MADLRSISRLVDDVKDDVIIEQQTVITGSSSDNQATNGVIETKDLNGGIVAVSAATSGDPVDTEHIRTTILANTDTPKVRRPRFLPNIRRSILKKSLSEPQFRHVCTSGFENEAFEKEPEYHGYRRRSTFADIVTEATRTQIKEDIHPYGRGHLYRTALEKDAPNIHKDEEKFLIWVVATILILGIAAGVIVMSQMYTANQNEANVTSVSSSYSS